MSNIVEQGLEKVKGTWSGIRTYVTEVKAESKKVTWPTKKEVRDTTIVVIIAVFIFGIYLYLVDLVLLTVLDRLMKVVS